MAKLNGPFDFSGNFGNFSVYKMRGVDKLVVRRKGGPSREQVNTSPRFARTRENNAEFKACTMLTRGIRNAVFLVNHLGDLRFTGALNSVGKQMQLLDKTSKRGQRGISLSRHGGMLAGFDFNAEMPFDNLFRHPLAVKTNRKKGTATVSIPGLIPGISLNLPWNAPFVRFLVSLGKAGDVRYNGTKFQPVAVDRAHQQYRITEWQHTGAASGPVEITLQLDKGAARGESLVLAIGIELGITGRYGEIEAAARAGAAKILAVF
ncbi:hypothetical protein [Chitinophaga alhagiae]|uniref:hypothetical protein n=1 Tax=Chitinophaga alhagiae TaxID=2203219 RepID=UPI000E5A37F9|nr:hypothetical protein [Chitinophaga alhagiae]